MTEIWVGEVSIANSSAMNVVIIHARYTWSCLALRIIRLRDRTLVHRLKGQAPHHKQNNAEGGNCKHENHYDNNDLLWG